MQWAGTTFHDEQRTVLEVEGVGVARMMERVDGTWFVVLAYHRPSDQRRQRDCSSLEQGRKGTEQWAARHMASLLPEVRAIRAKWPRLPTPDPKAPRVEHRPIFPDGDPPHPGKPRGKRGPRKSW